MIQKTKDYSMFKTIEGNREIDPKHLTSLTINIFKNNLLAANPIIVNKKMEVIDGQHRLEVARNNNLDIFYIVVDNAGIEDVMHLNAVNKTWTTKTYVQSYANRGIEDYVWLAEFAENYDLSITAALHIINGKDNNSWLIKAVKRGKFKAGKEQREKAESRGDVLFDVRPFLHKKGMLPNGFISAIVYLSDKGEGKRLVNALQKSSKEFVPEIAKKRAIEQLESFMK